MKKILFITVAIALLIACSKKENNEDENTCPVVDKSLVPVMVKSGFQTKYPSDSVITWFKKDSIGYCAYFIQPVNQRKLAEFTPLGVFVSEELDIEHDGDFEDSTGHSNPKNGSVCECEIPD
jgi:hypothetical protein